MSDLPVTLDELPASAPRSRRFELTIAILLGVAAITAGYTAYRADLDRGDSLRQFQVANKTSSLSIDAYSQGDVQRGIDEQIFVEYSKAVLAGDVESSAALRILSPDLRAAIRTWEETQGRALSPFAGDPPAYFQPFYEDGDELAAQATAEFNAADEIRSRADTFTLIGVLLASALFLYGIAAVSRAPKIRRGLTATGFAIYLGATITLLLNAF